MNARCGSAEMAGSAHLYAYHMDCLLPYVPRARSGNGIYNEEASWHIKATIAGENREARTSPYLTLHPAVEI